MKAKELSERLYAILHSYQETHGNFDDMQKAVAALADELPNDSARRFLDRWAREPFTTTQLRSYEETSRYYVLTCFWSALDWACANQ